MDRPRTRATLGVEADGAFEGSLRRGLTLSPRTPAVAGCTRGQDTAGHTGTGGEMRVPLLAVLLLISSANAAAHGGGLNAEGCHHNRKTGDYEKANEAQRRSVDAERNEGFGGDHTLRIAGPDSGFLPSTGEGRE